MSERQSGRRSSERGETLLELLIAVSIMGVAVVVLIGGLGTGVRISDIHHKQAMAGAQVHSFAEAIENAVAGSPTAYRECAATATYASAFAPSDPGYAAEVVAVLYWNGSQFGPACTTATDSGVQQVSLRVRSTDDAASETLDVIIRKPCRPVIEFPADTVCT